MEEGPGRCQGNASSHKGTCYQDQDHSYVNLSSERFLECNKIVRIDKDLQRLASLGRTGEVDDADDLLLARHLAIV